jgi:hypothetical protein
MIGTGRKLIFHPFHAFDPVVSQPVPFRVIHHLPQAAMGRWCYRNRDDRFAYFRRCKVVDQPELVLTPKGMDAGASSCRFEEVFTSLSGLGWTAFAACRGNATTGLRVYQVDAKRGIDVIGLHTMDDGPAEEVEGRR